MIRLLTALVYAYPWIFRRVALVACGLVALMTADAEAGRFRGYITVETMQTPCYAPCAVRASALGEVRGDRPFHDALYEWHFGDDPDATWRTGWSRNYGLGPETGHVYERPGQYVVGLRVTRGSEVTFERRVVRVLDPESATQKIVLERGRTYPAPTLPAGGGVVLVRGTGAPPVVTGIVTARDGWNLSGFTIAGGISIPPNVSNVTLYQINGTVSGVSSMTGGGTRHSSHIAIADCEFLGSASVVTLLFLRIERSVILGNLLDNQGVGEFNLRTVHFAYGVIAHNQMRRPGNRGFRNNLQIRAWASDFVPRVPSERIVILDNDFEGSTGNWIVRFCQENRCTATWANAQNVQDVIVEKNRFVGPQTLAISAAAGDVTVRDNDLSRWTGSVVWSQEPNAAPGLNNQRIRVEQPGLRPGVTPCRGPGCM